MDLTGPTAGRLDPTPPDAGERFDRLISRPGMRIEHIVSSASPDPAPYRQVDDEWVLLLAGAAVLEVGGVDHVLGAGDWVWLPAGLPHRVVSAEAGTRWLAVHHEAPAQG